MAWPFVESPSKTNRLGALNLVWVCNLHGTFMVQIAVNFSHTSIFRPRQFFAHVNISSVLFSRFFQKREKRENITGAKKTRFTVDVDEMYTVAMAG